MRRNLERLVKVPYNTRKLLISKNVLIRNCNLMMKRQLVPSSTGHFSLLKSSPAIPGLSPSS